MHKDYIKDQIELDKFLHSNHKFKMLVECKTDREKMLCEQVLRMCRGEASEILVEKKWVVVNDLDALYPSHEYRAKPKKELIVPWEWIPDNVFEITVPESGVIYNNFGYTMHIKLDLEGIELPVTVNRP